MDVWNKLDALFSRHPVLRSTGVSDAEIADAERLLHRQFSAAYREFLKRYGGAIVGSFPVLGLRQAEPMGSDCWNVVEVTQRFWADTWPGTADWYIVSVDGSGNPVGLDAEGRVWISDHNDELLRPLANDFAAWIDSLL